VQHFHGNAGLAIRFLERQIPFSSCLLAAHPCPSTATGSAARESLFTT
jgi:hypothetical protein